METYIIILFVVALMSIIISLILLRNEMSRIVEEAKKSTEIIDELVYINNEAIELIAKITGQNEELIKKVFVKLSIDPEDMEDDEEH